MSAIKDSGLIFTKVRASHVFEVLDDSCTTFRSEHLYDIRAELRTRFFQRRFQWTGSNHDEEPVLETTHDMWGYPEQRVHGPVIREGSWRIVLVDLGRTYEIGDTGHVHFHHRLRDLNGQFDPFLGHCPKPGTKHIHLKVILPESLAKDVIYDQRMLDTEKVIFSKPLKGEGLLPARYQFEMDVPNPRFGEDYRIRWTRPSR